MERAELAQALESAVAVGFHSGFMRDLVARVRGKGRVLVEDAGWGPSERGQFEALTAQPDAAAAGGFNPERDGWLMIPSGGTGGRVKLARHDQGTIAAAVQGFCRHFGAARTSAVSVLPAHHVSGLMAWARCALSGGRLVPWNWKHLEAGDHPELPAGDLVSVSLVPTQLQRLLAQPEAIAWLRRFDVIFLGGGAPWPALLDAAAAAGLPLSVGYGMTETAAMACGQLPGEFLAGDRSSGHPLPHVRIAITADGVAALSGPSIFKGYYPAYDAAAAAERTFTTEDLAAFDAQGRLHLQGRRDAVIISGGKKVDPAEVEAALRASGLFSDVTVIGIPDAEWGQVVTLCHPAADGPIAAAAVAAALGGLASHKHPRRLIALPEWPRTAQGKINRLALQHAALQAAQRIPDGRR